MGSVLCSDSRDAETHENQGGVDVLIVLLHVFRIVLRRLSFVHGIEIDSGIVVLDRYEEHSQGLLETIWS